ncbi:major facilitator superfamily domain-containing protein [Aspergillus granulosus]|uniref:Major facilitator superfamily domain-containing protein n=1 Tax=Aspergillus granulosus TaxID=176169 RepID=A0ABR4HMR9_9EURO
MTYTLNFLDKQTLNYSNAYSLQEDTNMTGDDYSWVSSALYIGWLVVAYPWQLILQRYPVGRLTGIMLFAAVFEFAGFFAIRFFLGLLEAGVSPAFIILTSMLWTREEQSLRSSYWLAMNGYRCHSRCTVGIVGPMTMAWGFVTYAYLPAQRQNADRKRAGRHRVAYLPGPNGPQTTQNHPLSDPLSPPRPASMAPLSHGYLFSLDSFFMDSLVHHGSIFPRLLAPNTICYGILNGGVANFLVAIIKRFGYSPLRTSLLQTPVGGIQVVMVIAFGYLSKVRNMLGATIVIACVPGLAGLIGLITIPHDESHRFALVGMCWLQGILRAPVVLNWTLPGLNTAGHTKRSIVLGIYFVIYCAGNIAGPHLFLTSEAPRYQTAIKGLAGSYGAAMGLQIIYTGYCWVENRRKARKGLLEGADSAESAMESFEDPTDKQDKHLRYRV